MRFIRELGAEVGDYMARGARAAIDTPGIELLDRGPAHQRFAAAVENAVLDVHFGYACPTLHVDFVPVVDHVHVENLGCNGSLFWCHWRIVSQRLMKELPGRIAVLIKFSRPSSGRPFP